MVVTKLSVAVAEEISTDSFLDLSRFKNEAIGSAVILFIHHNYFYSFPEWGTKWKYGNKMQYHRVDTKCAVCGYEPERNIAGVGYMYLRNDHNKFKILCPEHAKLFPRYNALPCREPRHPFGSKQLSLEL